MTDKQMLKEMFSMQDKFNERVVENWRQNITDEQWKTAILLETAEMIDSLSWKWWKKQKTDWDNYVVELVDVWHFVISLYNISFPIHDVNYLWSVVDELDIQPSTDESEHILRCKEFVSAVLDNENVSYVAYKFFILLRLMDMDITDLYVNYIVKNTLNEFRQNKGYKTGQYKKEWLGADGNKYEDNVIVFHIAHSMPIDRISYDLYQEIEKFYDKIQKEK